MAFRGAVITFPGSNCDRDMAVALEKVSGEKALRVWHADADLPGRLDFIAIPGGFSYGDYLRCGAIASRSPVMRAVIAAAGRGVPVLGVCRGFQFMNVHLGGGLSPVSGHVASYHAISSDTGLFPEVNSYHDYGIVADDLAPSLEVVATGPDGTVEAARHGTLPWIGVMWHPERERPFAELDRRLVRAHLLGSS